MNTPFLTDEQLAYIIEVVKKEVVKEVADSLKDACPEGSRNIKGQIK